MYFVKLLIPLSFIALVLLISPALAANNKNNQNDNPNKAANQEKQEEKKESKNTGTIQVGTTQVVASPSANPTQGCDPNANWKNHGEYVSCVAKLKLGGKVVSEAARSDVGKKNSTSSATPSPKMSVTPTATSSATPSATPTISEGTESAGLTNPTINALNFELKFLIQSLKNLLASFKFR